MNKNCFSTQNEPYTAKLFFSVVLDHFHANSLKKSLFSQKSDYLKKEHRKTQKVFFVSTSLYRGKSRGNCGFVVNNPFCSLQ